MRIACGIGSAVGLILILGVAGGIETDAIGIVQGMVVIAMLFILWALALVGCGAIGGNKNV
jgi:hypothetical protein